jgi:hypothetical protein
MVLTFKQVSDVCLLRQGHRECRYLEGDDIDPKKFYCKKKSPDRKHIDDLVQEYLDECEADGEDPRDGGVALGDGCAGYINLKNVPQGYDVED